MMFFILWLSTFLHLDTVEQADTFYKVNCINGKEYTVYANEASSKVTILEDEQSIYNNRFDDFSRYHKIKDVYCYNNDLYFILHEYKKDQQTDEDMYFYSLYQFENNNFTKQEVLSTFYQAQAIQDGLVYYESSDQTFRKALSLGNFENKEIIYENVTYEGASFYYIESTSQLLYAENNKLYLVDNGVGTFIKNVDTLQSIIGATSVDDKLYFIFWKGFDNYLTFESVDKIYGGTSEFKHKFGMRGHLFSHEDGLYAFITDDKKLKLYAMKNDNTLMKIKVLSENVLDSKMYGNTLYSLSGNTISFIEGAPDKLETPSVQNMEGILDYHPVGFTFSNISIDDAYFVKFHFDISASSDFSNPINSGSLSDYTLNTSMQTLALTQALEAETLYYLRLRYESIFDISEYYQSRFIVYNIGSLTSLTLKGNQEASPSFTKERNLEFILEKEGSLDLVQIATRSDFLDEQLEDVHPVSYASSIHYTLVGDEGEHTYYVRPALIIDGEILGTKEYKEAKIIYDITPPAQVESLHSKTFPIGEVNISWDKPIDNLSGIKGYKVELHNENDELIESKEIEELIYAPTEELTLGKYKLSIMTCDHASNCSEPAVFDIQVANNKPYKPKMLRPLQNEVLSGNSFTVAWTESIDPEGDELSYTLMISKTALFNDNEVEFHRIEGNNQDISYLSEGHYYLKLFAVDEHGNESEHENIEFDVINPKSKSGSGCSFQ